MIKSLKQLIGDASILATNKVGFAIADDLETAAKNCKKHTRLKAVKFFIVPKGTTIDGMTIEYPADAKFTSTQL